MIDMTSYMNLNKEIYSDSSIKGLIPSRMDRIIALESHYIILKSFSIYKCGHKFHEKCVVSYQMKVAEDKGSKKCRKSNECMLCIKFDFLIDA